MLPNISVDLAKAVGAIHGIAAPDQPTAPEGEYGQSKTEKSPPLSLMARLPGDIKHRKVAILAADGVDADQVSELQSKLKGEGATPLVIAPSMASVKAANGNTVDSDGMLNSLPSVTVDAVIVPGGKDSVEALGNSGLGVYYPQEAYKHLKVIATVGEGRSLLQKAGISENEDGVLCGDSVDAIFGDFYHALGQHRVWSRNDKANLMPA
jgi:catalase